MHLSSFPFSDFFSFFFLRSLLLLCNTNLGYFIPLLHQLLFGSFPFLLHPVACDSTCWIHKPRVQGQVLGFPFSHHRCSSSSSSSSSLHSGSNLEKTCQFLALWLFSACTCEESGCVVMWAELVCVCFCVCVSSHRAQVQEQRGHRGRSDFTSFTASTCNKPQ